MQNDDEHRLLALEHKKRGNNVSNHYNKLPDLVLVNSTIERDTFINKLYANSNSSSSFLIGDIPDYVTLPYEIREKERKKNNEPKGKYKIITILDENYPRIKEGFRNALKESCVRTNNALDQIRNNFTQTSGDIPQENAAQIINNQCTKDSQKIKQKEKKVILAKEKTHSDKYHMESTALITTPRNTDFYSILEKEIGKYIRRKLSSGRKKTNSKYGLQCIGDYCDKSIFAEKILCLKSLVYAKIESFVCQEGNEKVDLQRDVANKVLEQEYKSLECKDNLNDLFIRSQNNNTLTNEMLIWLARMRIQKISQLLEEKDTIMDTSYLNKISARRGRISQSSSNTKNRKIMLNLSFLYAQALSQIHSIHFYRPVPLCRHCQRIYMNFDAARDTYISQKATTKNIDSISKPVIAAETIYKSSLSVDKTITKAKGKVTKTSAPIKNRVKINDIKNELAYRDNSDICSPDSKKTIKGKDKPIKEKAKKIKSKNMKLIKNRTQDNKVNTDNLRLYDKGQYRMNKSRPQEYDRLCFSNSCPFQNYVKLYEAKEQSIERTSPSSSIITDKFRKEDAPQMSNLSVSKIHNDLSSIINSQPETTRLKPIVTSDYDEYNNSWNYFTSLEIDCNAVESLQDKINVILDTYQSEMVENRVENEFESRNRGEVLTSSETLVDYNINLSESRSHRPILTNCEKRKSSRLAGQEVSKIDKYSEIEFFNSLEADCDAITKLESKIKDLLDYHICESLEEKLLSNRPNSANT